MTKRELKPLPCPFCGGIDISTHEGSNFRWMVAECMTCGAMGSEIRKQTMGKGNPQQWHEEAQRRAMEEWNTRTRLTQPEPEPAAWMTVTMGEVTSMQPHMIAAEMFDGTHQLYTAPPQREWKGLTDEEIDELAEANLDFNWKDGVEDFARAIEAKLKEKNT